MLIRACTVALIPFVCAAPATGAEPQGVHVVLETSMGEIEVEVWPERAPHSACDFLAYVEQGLYARAAFYRVVRHDNDRGRPKIEVIQGGLDEDSSPRRPVTHESTQMTGLKHVDGALSLARGAVGTARASAFFVAIGDQPGLDYGGERNADRQGFAVFGKVVRGMDVVRRIHHMAADAPTDEPYLQGQLLSRPVAISKATRTVGDAGLCRAVSRR